MCAMGFVYGDDTSSFLHSYSAVHTSERLRAFLALLAGWFCVRLFDAQGSKFILFTGIGFLCEGLVTLVMALQESLVWTGLMAEHANELYRHSLKTEQLLPLVLISVGLCKDAQVMLHERCEYRQMKIMQILSLTLILAMLVSFFDVSGILYSSTAVIFFSGGILLLIYPALILWMIAQPSIRQNHFHLSLITWLLIRGLAQFLSIASQSHEDLMFYISQVLWSAGYAIPVLAVAHVWHILHGQSESARHALWQENRKLTATLEGTRAGTWSWNIQTGETVFNEEWANIIGYTLKELEPVSIETWLKFAHPDDLSDSEKRLNEHFQKKKPYYECEARMKHKEGHYVWVFDRGKVSEWTPDGKPLMMYGTHQDITSSKNMELRLKENHERMVMASMAAGFGVFDYDFRTQKLIWDHQMFEIFKVDPGTFRGEFVDWQMTVHPDDIERAESLFMKAMTEGEKFDAEFRIIWPDGEVRHIKGLALPVMEEGKAIRAIGINADITSRVRNENLTKSHLEEMKHINQELKEANQKVLLAVEAKSKFLANMSHEIRTPMNGILGFTHILTEKENDPEKLQYLSLVKENSELLLSIINDILDFSKIETGKMNLRRENFDLKNLVNSVVRSFQQMTLNENIRIDLTLDDSLKPRYFGDEQRIRQILYNLLSNAVKFGNKQPIQVTCQKAGDSQVVFSVKDHGIGIT